MSYDAAGFRSYREIRKLLGRAVPSGSKRPPADGSKRAGHQPRKPRDAIKAKQTALERFRQLTFCAWDGEGIGHPRNRYVMLQNSRGVCLEGHDLTSEQIFECLLEQRADKRTVHVVYGGVYDFTHWILGLPDELKRQIHETGTATWKQYTVLYTPRKSFRLEDRSRWVERHRGESAAAWRQRNLPNRREIMVWDVIGFFQSSFLTAIRKWDVGTLEQHYWISQMKLKRGQFDEAAHREILAYNNLECELLEALMRKLHRLLLTNPIASETANDVWLPLKRWDGAGAVAAAIYRKEGVQEHVGSSVEADLMGRPFSNWHYRDKQEQSDIEYALRCAYFGGRIECFQRGRANAPGYDIDIVSAYPAAMRDLPSFAAGGRWHWTDSFDANAFGVWQTEWHCQAHAIYPLPYRTHTGGVLFPAAGKGWHHTIEVATAMADKRNRVVVTGGYVWRPSTEVRPFAFVDAYFRTRKELQRKGDAAEKVIKLGLNSLYGKMAQTLGSTLESFPCPDARGIRQCRTESVEQYIDDCAMDKIFLRTPPFFNLAWAGAVTAHCRATVYRECMPRESEITMIQTDGMFGVGNAPSYSSTGELGSFDVVLYDDAIIVQAGVYYLGERKEDGSIQFEEAKTRGFFKDEVDYERVLAAWKAGDTLTLAYQSQPRFQTLGFSVSKRSFDGLAHWNAQERQLALYTDSKRTSVTGLRDASHWRPNLRADLKRLRLFARLQPTYGLLNLDFEAGCPSRPTDPKWREKLHATGTDDFALTEPLIEGSDFLDNFALELQDKFGF